MHNVKDFRFRFCFCCIFLSILVVCKFAYVDSGVSGQRFEKLFRVNLSEVQSISWKQWVNKHGQGFDSFPLVEGVQKTENSQIRCVGGNLLQKHSNRGSCCDVSNDTCDSQVNLQCIEYRCQCKVGTFLNEESGVCERKNGKQLTETCLPDDNCFTAFSVCLGDVCECIKGFTADGLQCIPNIYRCPFGDPMMLNGHIWPCAIFDPSNNVRRKDQCPRGFECISPPDANRPRFITVSGVEKGYCCPLIPDMNNTILFQDQCFYGEAVSPFACPPETHVYAMAISMTPLCCPKPCRPNYAARIVNGMCIYNIIS